MKRKRCPYCGDTNTGIRLSQHRWGAQTWWMGVEWCHDCGKGFGRYWNQTQAQLALE